MDSTLPNPVSQKKQKTLKNDYLQRLHRIHAWIVNTLAFGGTGMALFLWYWGHPPGWMGLFIFLGMWFITTVGFTVGYHRYFAHRSFQTSPAVHRLLAVLGSMLAIGNVTLWVSIHH